MKRRQELSLARAENVGSSEVPVLFGHGYAGQTRYKLHLEKAGNLPEDSETQGTEAMEIGLAMENTIADLTRDRLGATGHSLQSNRAHRIHRVIKGSAATIDFMMTRAAGTLEGVKEIMGGEVSGAGVLETKNVSNMAFNDKYERGATVPLQVQLQVQQQLSVTGWGWGIVAVLVGGSHMHFCPIRRHPQAIERIEREIPIFWRAVRHDHPPDPDWERDSELVVRVQSELDPGRILDLTEHEEATALARSYVSWGEIERAAAKRRKIARTELLHTYVKNATLTYFADGGELKRRRSEIAERVTKAHVRNSFHLKFPKESS